MWRRAAGRGFPLPHRQGGGGRRLLQDDPVLTDQDLVLGIRPEFLDIADQSPWRGDLWRHAHRHGVHHQGAGGRLLLTGVIFGSSLFTIGEKVPVTVSGDNIMLFHPEERRLSPPAPWAVKRLSRRKYLLEGFLRRTCRQETRSEFGPRLRAPTPQGFSASRTTGGPWGSGRLELILISGSPRRLSQTRRRCNSGDRAVLGLLKAEVLHEIPQDGHLIGTAVMGTAGVYPYLTMGTPSLFSQV